MEVYPISILVYWTYEPIFYEESNSISPGNKILSIITLGVDRFNQYAKTSGWCLFSKLTNEISRTKKLEAREASGEFIQIGLIGAGEMAQGFVNQVERYMPGMRVAAIYNRTSKRAHNAYVIAGIENTIEVSHKDKLDVSLRQHSST